MCDKLCCRGESGEDGFVADLTKILILGVTGMTGGAVAEACSSSAWFSITGLTRAAKNDEFVSMLTEKGIEVVCGDMTNYQSVLTAMDNIHCVFLTTHYWETMNQTIELLQGTNVVKAATAKGVRHIIFASTDYTTLTAGEKCKYLEAKARIETIIVNCGIPYTIVRVPFFYENFLGVFKPHKTNENEYAIAFPMGDKGLNMCSALDFGHCIARIAVRPHIYYWQTLSLSADYKTVEEIAESFNKVFIDRLFFYDPKITLYEYRTLEFEGVDEMTTMWAHYTHSLEWDRNVMDELCHLPLCLDKFVEQREKKIFEVLNTVPEILPEQSKEQASPAPGYSGNNSNPDTAALISESTQTVCSIGSIRKHFN